MASGIEERGLTSLWWVPLVTGLICIGLGIWTLCAPAESIPVLAYAFAICMVVAGVFNLIYGCMAWSMPNRWWSAALGLLEIIAGAWLLVLPAPVLAGAFVVIVGVWILVAAINAVCEACVMSRYSMGAFIFMILLLIATIIMAMIFLSDPIAGGIAVWLWIGISFICFGIYRIALAAVIKKIRNLTGGAI